MARRLKHLYDFGSYRLDAANRLLLKDGEPISLSPIAFDTLLAVVQDNEKFFEHGELMERVLPDSFFEDGSMYVADKRGIPSPGEELVVKEHIRLRIVVEREEHLRQETGYRQAARAPSSAEAKSSYWKVQEKTWVILLSIIALILIFYYQI